MRRVIVIAATGLSLAGCSSFPSMDVFKSTPPSVLVRLELVPSGADARTSLGPGCKTPCSVSVTPPDGGTGFTVNYSLPRYLPASVQVQVFRTGGDLFTSATLSVDPNPVNAALQPEAPPPRAHKVMRPKKRKPAAAQAPAAAGSPFPDPASPQTH